MLNNKSRRITLPVVFTYIALLMAPEFILVPSYPWYHGVIDLIYSFCLYSVLSWALCAVGTLFKGKFCTIYHVFLHCLIGFYSISNIWLLLQFQRHWDAFTIQFVNETTPKESFEFFTTYVLSLVTLAIIAAYVTCFVIELLLIKLYGLHVGILPRKKYVRYFFLLFCCAVSCNVVFFTSNAYANFERASGIPIKYNALWNLHQSFLQYNEDKIEYDMCAKKLSSYSEKPEISDSIDFVLIIGESFNRHASNLYDGKYNTNPLLKKRQMTGRLFAFDDVIAPSNGTTTSLKAYFSMASVSDSGHWYDAPLFPLIVRKCGYNVVFESNQFVRNDDLKGWDSSMGFINHPAIEPYLFDHRNDRLFQYDMQMVDAYESLREKVDKSSRNFYIFHLFGQHVTPDKRYPNDSFGSFNSDNVGRDDIDEEARRVVAHYLNATEYNDMVVDKIISLFDDRNAVVLYLADHGEEIFDFRNRMGRTDLSTDVKEAMQCQLDIPFIIYYTEKYALLHPDAASQFTQSLHKPFMSDDLPHVIFDIMGIKSRLFIPEKSILNEKYKPVLHRRLMIGRLYD